jgi:type I restriction enzyme S subunit
VTTSEVQYGVISTTKERITSAGLSGSSAKIFPPGTLLIALYGLGKTRGQVAILGIEAATNQACAAILPVRGFDTEFLFYSLKNDYDRIRRLSNTGGQDNLSAELVKEIRVSAPPIRCQKKIAAIVRTWDEALDKLTALRASRKDRLTALIQRLLGRGGVFPDKWSAQPLSAIATRVRRLNGGVDHPVMTISARSGFLMQSDKFARDMAGSSVERYTLLHEGEFAYNKGNSLSAPYGCIYRLDRPTALVPFVYFCFALKSDLDHAFYEHLFAAGVLNHQLSRKINSGVRNDGLLNLSADDFFDCKVPVPKVDEQRRIGSALSAAKAELSLLDNQIEALTRQKRGLMQKLLTGEWRVTDKN